MSSNKRRKRVRSAAEPKRKLKRLPPLTIAGGLIVVLAIVYVAITSISGPETTDVESPDTFTSLVDRSHIKGDPDAKVTVLEFGDFQ